MNAELAGLLALSQQALLSGGLVFLRVGAIMALLPAFGEQMVPVRVRLGLTLAFTVALAPAVVHQFPTPATMVDLAQLVWIEIVAGLALGIVFRLSVVVLQVAGTIAANVVSLSQILGGASVDPQPAMAHVLVLGGLALAAMTGLHEKILGAMILSYEAFPPGRGIAAEMLAGWGSLRIGSAFAMAFALSAPFVIASLLYNLALGAINRAMPQLMVAFVGAPAITAGGLVLLCLAAPLILGIWLQSLDLTLSTLGGP